jgi:hypothetical protein
MGTSKGKAPTPCIDLSFLKIHNTKANDNVKYGLYNARSSLAIHGSDDRRWVAFAFVDRDFDCEDLEEENCCYRGAQDDPIALDGEQDPNYPVVDANMPIWDPREYFLRIFEIRMAKVLREWENVVRVVGVAIERNVCCEILQCSLFFPSYQTNVRLADCPSRI